MTATFLKHLFLLFILIATLNGCATSGGGSPARFTSISSQEIALTPYYLSDPTEGGDHAWYMKLKISDKVPVAGFLKPNQMLTESLTHSIYASTPVRGQPFSASALQKVKGCEGSYVAQIDMQTGGEFRGTLTFTNYADDCSLVLNGQVPFEGELNMLSGETEVELSLPPLSASLAEKNLQLSGKLELEFNSFKGEKQLVITQSWMNIADETGHRISLRPVTFSWDRRGDALKEIIEGQVAVEPYGVVQLKTASPIQISSGRKRPFDGALMFHGANESWIRLLFAKPGLPGFFRLDGSDDFETIGQL